MKKLIAAALAALCIISALSGCGYKDALENTSSENQTTTTAATTDEAVKTVNASDYADSFDGLCDYFRDKGYIVEKAGEEVKESNVTVMDASLIGAEQGKKFVTKYNGNAITIELYAYNVSALNDTAKDIISSVKSSGTFTILDLAPVSAYLSDSGKYLMIYTDASINSDNPDTSAANYTHRQEVIEDLAAFHK